MAARVAKTAGTSAASAFGSIPWIAFCLERARLSKDAKDFDDAICVVPAPENHWKLWVHIADVSHYVKPGTALDEEAAKRGNSTYLVDRVIPMLPEALSNELCSLKPNVDRLTKCVEFVVSSEGRVLSRVSALFWLITLGAMAAATLAIGAMARARSRCSTSSREYPRRRPSSHERRATRVECPSVYGSRASIAATASSRCFLASGAAISSSAILPSLARSPTSSMPSAPPMRRRPPGWS